MGITKKELNYIKRVNLYPKNKHLKAIHQHLKRYNRNEPEFWIVGFDEKGNSVTYDGPHDSHKNAEDSMGLLNPLNREGRDCYRIIKVFPKTYKD